MKKRFSWIVRLSICLLLVAILWLAIWSTHSARKEAAGNLGFAAPKDRRFQMFDPSTWLVMTTPLDWVDQTKERLNGWKHSPWKIEDEDFGTHLVHLKKSSDPTRKAELRRLEKLAREWHDRMAARYPELATEWRDIPDERNGLFQLENLARRTGESEMSSLWGSSLRVYQLWNVDAATQWLEREGSLIEEIRRIGLMPERSSKFLHMENDGYRSFSMRFTDVMLVDARAAAEAGDVARALSSIQAAVGLTQHYSESETGTGGSSYALVNIQSKTNEHIIHLIPPDQLRPEEWKSALLLDAPREVDMGQYVRHVWRSTNMRYLLPALSDPAEYRTPPDPDAVAESYTRHMVKWLQHVEGEPTSNDTPRFDPEGLSWRGKEIMESVGISTISEEMPGKPAEWAATIQESYLKALAEHQAAINKALGKAPQASR